MTKSATAILFILAMVALIHLARTSNVFAAPVSQSTPISASPTPTDEPPKPPYVFPTPIFIPTFPGDTPSAPRTPGQPTGQTTYIVQSGDSPWIIAQKVYGNGSKYPLIMSANGLSDSTRLRVGMTLTIPLLDGAQPPLPATPPATKPTAEILAQPTTSLASSEISATPDITFTTVPTDSTPIAAGSLATAAINLIAAVLLIGACIAAILAFLIYRRSRRLEEMNPSQRGLQIRQ